MSNTLIQMLSKRIEIEELKSKRVQEEVLNLLKDKVSEELYNEIEETFIKLNFNGN